MRITLLLADDHEIVREGLRTLFDKETDLKVIAEAGDGQQAVQLALKLVPDVVIMDVAMPRMNGMEATRRIVDSFPDIKVIALSQSSDRRLVREMLAAGASGYVLKSCRYADLLKAIRAVVARKRYLCAPLEDTQLSGEPITRQRLKTTGSALTSREREVLQLLAEGKTTREIAALLTVSIKTIETHRLQIMTKLNTRSIAELTKFAIREGITSLDH